MGKIFRILHGIVGAIIHNPEADLVEAVNLITSAAEKEQAIHGLAPGASLEIANTNAELESVPGRLVVTFVRDAAPTS